MDTSSPCCSRVWRISHSCEHGRPGRCFRSISPQFTVKATEKAKGRERRIMADCKEKSRLEWSVVSPRALDAQSSLQFWFCPTRGTFILQQRQHENNKTQKKNEGGCKIQAPTTTCIFPLKYTWTQVLCLISHSYSEQQICSRWLTDRSWRNYSLHGKYLFLLPRIRVHLPACRSLLVLCVKFIYRFICAEVKKSEH